MVSAGTLRRHFKRQGWTIGRDTAWFISFFITKRGIGLVGVCIVNHVPTVGTLSGSHRISEQLKCRLLVIARDPVTEPERAAFGNHAMTLVSWHELGSLEAELGRTGQTGVADLQTAKRSLDRTDPATIAAARDLTTAEQAAGCFFATRNVFCRFFEGDGQTLVILFAEAPTDPAKPWARCQAYRKAGPHAVLSLETPTLNWFPNNDVRACLAAIEDKIAGRYPVRLLVGAGQGGYGALRYSAALQAAAALALAPTFSIDPAVVKDDRSNRHYQAALHSGMYVAPEDVCDHACALFDPYEPADRTQMARYQAATPVSAIPAPFAGHDCRHLLMDFSFILQALSLIAAAQPVPLANAVAHHRSRNKARPMRMAAALATRHPRHRASPVQEIRAPIPRPSLAANLLPPRRRRLRHPSPPLVPDPAQNPPQPPPKPKPPSPA